MPIRESLAVRIKVTLAVGLALATLAALAVLRHAPLTVAATNDVPAAGAFGVIGGAGAFCQPGETLPRGVSAIRVSFAATTGPRVALTVASSGGHLLTGGTVGSGWFGSAVTIPVRPLARAHALVTICARFGAITGEVVAQGLRTGVAQPRHGFAPGRLSVVYLRPGGRSWWSLAGSVIDHMALGRAAPGRWVALPIAALMLVALALAAVALTRELR